MKNKLTTFWYITIGLVIVKLTIHFLTYTTYELHRDEMLYFAMGKHLSFGYASTPPLIGFLAFISRMLFGYSEFGVKLFPALVGAASIVIIALIIKEFGGKNLAIIIAGIGFIVPGAFLRSNNLFQPVSFDQFFWLLASYLVLRMVNTQNLKLWLWVGLIFGLAFLNKYAIVFFVFAIVTALLISRHRKLLFSKYFLFGMLVAILIALPNILWQYTHNWPVVNHMEELQKYQLIHVTLSHYFMDQLMNCLSSALIWMAGLIMILFIPREKKFRYIAYTYIIVLTVIALGNGKGYYTLGAYPILYAAGGYTMEKYFTGKMVYIIYAVLVLSVASSIIFLPLELPVASFKTVEKYCDPETGILPQVWEDGETHAIPQDYADMTGWQELASIAAKAYNSLEPSQKEKCLIFAGNYGLAGAIEFYGHKYGLPEPISFHDSYPLWAPDSITEGPLIYIDYEIRDIKDVYDNYSVIGRVNDNYFREKGVAVFLCTNPKKGLKQLYIDKLNWAKSKYN